MADSSHDGLTVSGLVGAVATAPQLRGLRVINHWSDVREVSCPRDPREVAMGERTVGRENGPPAGPAGFTDFLHRWNVGDRSAADEVFRLVYQELNERELGHGGMGVVYLANRVDGEFRRQVALKVLKRGMDSDEFVRRFQNERQILADLTHPNIAGLFEGGT